MSTQTAVDPATLMSPVVAALAQIENAERELQERHRAARAALVSAQKHEVELERELARARETLAVLRKLAGGAIATTPPRVRRVGSAPSPAPLHKGHRGMAGAASRELVLLRLIADGVSTTKTLRDALPVAPGATGHQHTVSVANALHRLKSVRGLIASAGTRGEWSLTAKGRKHLAAAAKEAP